ncbi:MAG TPA: hypothetical protein VEU33_17855, partial [Archangium sp.]|nr:hypothetical protein [Archangium sp.]
CPKLTAEGTPRVQDDPDANTVVLEEHYKLEDAWAGGGLSVAATQVSRELALPRRTEGRVHPVEVSHPVHLRVRWEVHADSLLNVAPSEKTVEGPASRMDMSVVPRFGGFTYQVEYRSLADRVAPDALTRHVEAVKEMSSLLGISFATPMGIVSASSTSKDTQLSRNTSLAISGVFLVVVGALVLGIPRRFRQFLRERKARRAAPPRPVRHLREREQGAAVMIVESLDQAEQRIRSERCSCGGTFERVPDALQLRHTGSDGRAITVLRVRCMSCRAPQFFSFDVRPS